MAREPDPKPNNPAQHQRFLDLAKEVDAEHGAEHAVEPAVKKLAKAPRPPKPAKKGN